MPPEPTAIKLARLEGKIDTLIINSEAVRAAQSAQGLRIAALPCDRHSKRISEALKTIGGLSVNGVRSATRMATVWTAIKIAGVVLVSVAGLLFTAWNVVR